MAFKPGQSGNPNGRRKGTPNKATTEIKMLAREYGPEAILKLVKLMRGQDKAIDLLVERLAGVDPGEAGNEVRDLLALLSARNVQNELGATRELIDRGSGKATQHISADVTHSWESVVEVEFDGWLTGLFEPGVTDNERGRPN